MGRAVASFDDLKANEQLHLNKQLGKFTNRQWMNTPKILEEKKLTAYTKQSEVYINELEKLHKKHLKAIDKKNKTQRPLYYLIYTLLITILCLCFAIGWFKIKNNDLKTQNQEIYKHHYRFIKDKNLDAVYKEWTGNYVD